MTNPNRGRGGYTNGRGASPYKGESQPGPVNNSQPESVQGQTSASNSHWNGTNGVHSVAHGPSSGRPQRGGRGYGPSFRGGRGFDRGRASRGFRGRGRGSFTTPLPS